MISFGKNVRAALEVARITLGISVVAIVLLSGGAPASDGEGELPAGRSQDAELQKLEPALKFLRARNADTYAVRTKPLMSRLANRAMDHDSWRGAQ